MTGWRLCVPVLLLALAACREEAAEPAPAVVAGVIVEAAAIAQFRDIVDAYGSVNVPPRQARVLDSEASVIVDQVMVSPGQSVDVGTPLLRVRASADSTLELTRAKTELAFAEASQARTLRLFTQQLATNADVDLARQATANARATLASVHSRIGDGRAIVVQAPAAGIVVSVDVANAMLVPPGTPLLHLADSGPLQARLEVEPSDLGRVHQGQTVTLTAINNDAITATAVIAGLVAQIDPVSRMAEALVEVPPSSQLLPGTSVRAAIEVARREGALAVAHSAVLYAGDRPYVFVLKAGVARQVWVGVGQDDGKVTEITSGLGAGDLVVVEGNYELEDGMPVASTPVNLGSK